MYIAKSPISIDRVKGILKRDLQDIAKNVCWTRYIDRYIHTYVDTYRYIDQSAW